MSIKSDKWIRRMSLEQGMIKPFESKQLRNINDNKIISYGTSSYGYDCLLYTSPSQRDVEECGVPGGGW